MDKRKYLAKTLIAEYNNNSLSKDFNFIETAYRLKDKSIVIEYDGEGCSIYGIKINFNKYIARKGIFSISESDFKMWKDIRKDDKTGTFIDWELEKQLNFDEDYNQVFNIYNQDNDLELCACDDLPF